MPFQSGKGCIKQQQKIQKQGMLCAQRTLCHCAIQRCEYFNTRYPQVVGPKKSHVADSRCGVSWGDVVSRLQRIPKPGIFTRSQDGVCLNFCSICPCLSGEPGGARFLRKPTSLTLLRCKYERELFLKLETIS